MARDLQAFALDLQTKQDGDPVDVPSAVYEFGPSLFDIIEQAQFRDDQRETASTLARMAGCRARVQVDHQTGATMLT